jgi:hypothetical protein
VMSSSISFSVICIFCCRGLSLSLSYLFLGVLIFQDIKWDCFPKFFLCLFVFGI